MCSFANAGFSCRYPPAADFFVDGVTDRIARLRREVIVAQVSGPVPQDPPQLGILGLRECIEVDLEMEPHGVVLSCVEPVPFDCDIEVLL